MELNKEQAYDSQIHPLMGQIIEICQQHGIAMMASFAIPTPEDEHLRCTTALPDGDDQMPKDLQIALNLMMAGTQEPQTVAITIAKAAN